MRAIFSIVGLLVVVAIIGLLARKQLTSGVAPRTPDVAVPGAPAPAPGATPKQQVQQFEQAVQGAMQQARPLPADDK